MPTDLLVIADPLLSCLASLADIGAKGLLAMSGAAWFARSGGAA